MKEKIYTIPITESYEQDSECPFCYIEKKLETEAVEYALGAAMMEPDYRIISNEKGYCNRHFSQMFAKPNKLSLALVLDTHLNEVLKKLEESGKNLSAGSSKKGLFKKAVPGEGAAAVSEFAENLQHSCVVCDKIKETTQRYTEVFFYMWENREGFKETVLSSKGFCMKHFGMLTEGAYKHLKNPDEFVEAIYKLEYENLKRISEDIHKFTLKFDYRNKDMEWGTAIDAPVRTIEKLCGHIIFVKEDEKPQ